MISELTLQKMTDQCILLQAYEFAIFPKKLSHQEYKRGKLKRQEEFIQTKLQQRLIFKRNLTSSPPKIITKQGYYLLASKILHYKKKLTKSVLISSPSGIIRPMLVNTEQAKGLLQELRCNFIRQWLDRERQQLQKLSMGEIRKSERIEESSAHDDMIRRYSL